MIGLIISGSVLLFYDAIDYNMVGQIILGIGIALLAIYFLVLFVTRKNEQRQAILQVTNAQFEASYFQELNQKSGTIIYNDSGKIVYITD
jgi:hypothetical protein